MRDDIEVTDRTRGGVRREHGVWLVFSILALIEFMTVLDASIVNIALPSIQRSLGFSQTTLTWVVNAYLIGYAGFLLLAGRAADLFGRRRLFVAGTVLFTIASLACGLSPGAWYLIIGRFIEGLGAALAAPAALALITDIFAEGPERNRALGLFTGMAGVAAPIGLVLGGLLTTAAWQLVFLINVPIGIAVLIAALRLLPAAPPPDSGQVDFLGAATGTGGLCLLIYTAVSGDAQGWSNPVTLAELAGALVLIAAFVWRQRTAPRPMVPTFLLGQRSLVIGNIIIAIVGTLLFTTFFIITLYLQRVRGDSPLTAGLIYVPIPLAMLAGTQVGPRVAQRFGPAVALGSALLVQAIGLAWWAAAVGPNTQIITSFLLPTVVWSFGLGGSIVGSFIVCTMGLRQDVAGAGAGLATTTYQAGGALGLAILGTVATLRTSNLLAGSPVTAQTDPHALIAGYSLALWCGVGVAILGAVLAVSLRARPARAS
jgi:EmrB/QacA subfamily drug resistance transporter